MSWRWSIASGLLALSLTGCFAKSSDKIARELEQSVVLITYRDKPGHETGFFVPGAKDVCTVLTAKHVLAPSSDLNLTLDREIISSDTKIQPLRDVDLAILTFKPSKSKNCPYKPLKLGNSDRVEYGETISILGFPKREGDRNLVPQFTSGTVTRIEKLPLAEGYAISYDVTTVGGMSGAW
ncbi:MAG: trypsin-like peptidase domain-containing protein [Hormoscilla sp. SP5CHS1]|nr:trypsin-like peptidase domain-containing protein [Hormoscilla sp. SP5CHS1]